MENSVNISEYEIYAALERVNDGYIQSVRSLIETGTKAELFKTEDYDDFIVTIEGSDHFENYIKQCRKDLEVYKYRPEWRQK